MSDAKYPKSASRDTRWVEGLRGMAAVFVMTSHLALSYADFLEAARSKNQPPRWYNMPFIRVIFEGSPWVSVFLVLTGFVNALKPIKQTRAGHVDAALSDLASSCFRRSLRLMLPCTIATFLAWILAETGGFQTGRMVMSHWLVTTCAKPSGGLWLAIGTLFRAIMDTWSWNNNEIERNQWAMLYFLKGAMAVYVFLLATLKTRATYRMYLAAGLVAYGWRGLDAYIFMPIFTGVLLAEASQTATVHAFMSSRSIPLRILPYMALLFGWYCMSFPNRFPNRMPWSDNMLNFALNSFPENSDIHAYYNQIGVTFVIMAITFSQSLQRFFNLRLFQWLGARSFPIYLVHGPVLRSFLNWVLFAGEKVQWVEEVDKEGKVLGLVPMFGIPPGAKFLWALPLFLVATLVLADLWYRHVEPPCAQATKWIEERMRSNVIQSARTEKPSTPELSLSEAHFGSPLSRATTPMNEVDFVLPR
ncbi:uncharacterized protein PV09_04590 [Verruconis gallopava]|uniref:Acyltransferase 3 domain-containing protein n=1 Tax=Verruconis gallopava TaxID=253628 RepID=A0A0D2AYP2_9PEZI|nr:uncharacterized protein PV09_04590 [Verruconis gallopava]KIW04294.1 hypothetical protein PV09_04590 [Verruconis gallopava]